MPVFKCKYPTCESRLNDRGYCSVHQKQPEEAAKIRNELYDRMKRDPAMVRFYGSKEWEIARARKLAQSPLCEMCFRAVATTVHHTTPARQLSDADKINGIYLQSACGECHSRQEWRESHGIEAYVFTDPDWNAIK
jgi:hypothetical protein